MTIHLPISLCIAHKNKPAFQDNDGYGTYSIKHVFWNLMDAKLFLLACNLCLVSPLNGQRSEAEGGASPLHVKTECVSDAYRSVIHLELKNTMMRLRSEGILPMSTDRGSIVQFDFPMRWSPGFDDYGFYGISNFVDQDPNYPGFLLDYECGARTYDTDAGYNHGGIDYFLWPFAWRLVDMDAVQAIAAAPGTIVGKTDGNQHFSCSFSSDNWNAVYVMHADGSVAWYGHLKMNSLTSKDIGETVVAGEYLGIIASSGNSTAPHLHFEVHDAQNNLIDPNAGVCNSLNDETWWSDQLPYYNPRVNKIQTHFAPPEFNTCPELETTNASDEFAPGEDVYFVVYLADQRNTDPLQLSITMPNGLPFDLWSFSQPQSYLSASYWYWSNTLPMNAMEGTWTFRCVFAGEIYLHQFEVSNDISSAGDHTPEETYSFVMVNQNELAYFIKCNKGFYGTLRITDVSGRNVGKNESQFVAGENKIVMPVNDLSSGIYFLSLYDEKNTCLDVQKAMIHSK